MLASLERYLRNRKKLGMYALEAGRFAAFNSLIEDGVYMKVSVTLASLGRLAMA